MGFAGCVVYALYVIVRRVAANRQDNRKQSVRWASQDDTYSTIRGCYPLIYNMPISLVKFTCDMGIVASKTTRNIKNRLVRWIYNLSAIRCEIFLPRRTQRSKRSLGSPWRGKSHILLPKACGRFDQMVI